MNETLKQKEQLNQKAIERQKIIEQTKKELNELKQITGNFDIDLEQKSENDNYLIINWIKLDVSLKNFEEYFNTLHYIMKIIKIYKENKYSSNDEQFYLWNNLAWKYIHQLAHNDIMLKRNFAMDKTFLTEESIRKMLNIPELKKSKEYVEKIVDFLNKLTKTIEK